MLSEAARELTATKARAAPPPASAAPTTARAIEHAALAVQSSACAVADREPLGQPDDPATEPGLLCRLQAAVTECRQTRFALSLLLVELSHPDKVLATRGIEGLNRLRRLLEMLCQGLDHPQLACLPYGEASFAVVLWDCDRRQAVELGNELIDRVRRIGLSRPGSLDSAFTVGLGAATVALPPKNFPPRDLIEIANRCLYGSRASGGNVIKSIEIY